MRRAVFLFVALLAAGLLAAVVVCVVAHEEDEVEWLRTRFHLSNEQMEQAKALHREYEERCEEMCDLIVASEEELASALRENSGLTPRVRQALAENSRVRAECRTRMLAHFYQTAAILPEDRRDEYLEIVLPLVLKPHQTASHHP